MADMLLDVRYGLPGIGLVPAPVQRLGGQAQLDDEVAGEVFRSSFATFLPPQSQQGRLVLAHYDSGVRAPDESLPIGVPSDSRKMT
jgi:hypothetical protein